jgi:hypothetical protein
MAVRPMRVTRCRGVPIAIPASPEAAKALGHSESANPEGEPVEAIGHRFRLPMGSSHARGFMRGS